MSSFLVLLGFVGFIVFLIMGVLALVKKNGKGKRNFIIMACSFVLMIGATSNLPTNSTSSVEASTTDTQTDKSTKEKDNNKAEDKAKEEKAKKEAEEKAKKEADENAKAEAEKNRLRKMGETLQVGDVVFKVNKVKRVNEIKDGQFLKYEPDTDGSIFFVVNVTVKNAGKAAIKTDSSFFALNKGEITYSPTTLITSSKEFFLYDGINPGLSKTGNVVFEVPAEEAGFILNVQTGFWGTEQGQIDLSK